MTRLINTRTRNKYGAIKTEVNGITFDSKAEARRYEQLQLMQYGGRIKWFQRQPSFLLGNSVRYRPDFIVGGGVGILTMALMQVNRRT